MLVPESIPDRMKIIMNGQTFSTKDGIIMAEIEFAYMIQDILLAFIVVFSAALLAIAVISYRRTGNKKILYITAGFACFFTKGLLMTAALYTDNLDVTESFVPFLDVLILIDLLILLLLYYAMFKK